MISTYKSCPMPKPKPQKKFIVKWLHSLSLAKLEDNLGSCSIMFCMPLKKCIYIWKAMQVIKLMGLHSNH